MGSQLARARPSSQDRAAEGWLAFNVDSHDMPPTEATAPRNYASLGNNDRDSSYFLNMYLRDVRAIDFIRSNPHWDGKTIVIMGTSTGGQQSYAVAVLVPGITAMLVNVPAGANIADCIALCCATPGCQSFSFNVPPQQFAASATASAATARRGPPPSGLANCTPDNLVPCCRLKDAVPPLIANPYPETCQTGVLSNYTPPPSSGCVPPSRVLSHCAA